MSNPQEKGESASSLPEGLVLGYLTLLGYGVAFAYESSYLGFFGVDLILTELNLSRVLVAIFALIVFLFMARQVFEFAQDTGYVDDGEIGRMRGANLAVAVFNTPLVLATANSGHKVVAAIGTAVLIILIFIEIPLTVIHGKDVHTWKEKRKRLEERLSHQRQARKTKEKRKNPIDSLLWPEIHDGRWEKHVLRVLVGTTLLCITAYSLGKWTASSKKDFYTPLDFPETAIISKQGDKLIGIKFDRESKIFSNEITLIDLGSRDNDKRLELKMETIGPLHPEANK
jgi:hypothetical protein